MQSLVLCAALLASAVLARPNLQERQGDPASSISAQFSSAANQIISLYIPQSLAVPFGVAVQSAASAASVTGDINSIVESALTAETPPPFLTAIPTVYQSNLMSLESAISALRGAANAGISGAARVTTVTDSAGSTFTSTIPPPSTANGSVLTTTNSAGSTYTTTESGSVAAAAIVVLTTTNSAGSTFTTTTNEVVLTTTDSAGSTITSTMSGSSSPVVVVTTTDTAGSTVTSTQSGSSSSSAPPSSSTPHTSSSAAPSSSKSAFAAPTQVPIAAAGAIGLVGLLAAL